VTADDRDSVRANIADLGLEGALRYAYKRLPKETNPRVRRILVLTARHAARQLRQDIATMSRLARCHAIGLKTLGMKL
jgi:hypothetical protein